MMPSQHTLRAALALLAITTPACMMARAQAPPQPDCSAAPYNVPPGYPSSATTAALDQAHMMCLQGLQFPTPASNPPLTTNRTDDPNKPLNAWPGNLTTPQTSNWTDTPSHTVVRWGWGAWTTYDDSDSGGVANVLCGGVNGVPSPGCTVAAQKGTSTGGDMSGFGDYGPVIPDEGYTVVGSRPYPTGSAPVGDNGTTCTSPGCLASGHYTPIKMFTMKDGVTQIQTPEDWWLKRRPELFDLVQKEIYGYQIPQAKWPAITWTIGPVTTGSQTGTVGCITSGTTCSTGTVSNGVSYSYRQKTYTATFSTANYPADAPPLRNVPSLSVTCRFPASATGKVPTFLSFSETDNDFQYTAPAGFGVCGLSQATVQADSGGSSTSSYLSGLINGGNWRQPTDAGTLMIWAWTASRLIDEFSNDPDPIGPDPDKIAVEGHSRDGKATLVTAAFDDRVVAALPSCGGEGGTSFIRRAFGESVESIVGNGEYYWMAGNLMNYAGPECQTNPNVGPAGCTPAFFPRKVEELDVDAPQVMALIAPRAVMTNGGTDTPAGNGDAWQDPRAMYLSAAMAAPVWQFLNWPGLMIPANTAFTTNPTPYGSGESIGGTPPFNTLFADGTVAYRRHSQGHTDTPEWPWFVQFASRYLNDVRPVIASGQNLNLPPTGSSVGLLAGTAGGGGSISNWQIKGGNGAYIFAIDNSTGAITIPDRTKLNGNTSWTLTVMASDGILPTHDTVINISTPNITGNVQLITTSNLVQNADSSYTLSLTVTNNGTGTAQNVVLNQVTLAGVTALTSPQPLISLAPSGVAVTTLSFPASAGAPGARVIENVNGTYTGGTFGGSVRATLPTKSTP